MTLKQKFLYHIIEPWATYQNDTAANGMILQILPVFEQHCPACSRGHSWPAPTATWHVERQTHPAPARICSSSPYFRQKYSSCRRHTFGFSLTTIPATDFFCPSHRITVFLSLRNSPNFPISSLANRVTLRGLKSPEKVISSQKQMYMIPLFSRH